ncbi:hypothetical protein SASPL_135359 [Salvia splendens]|uniref:GFO/IDH/MocA-like oxidoreductase domain-containing protein n=1 Tax=Salvia splendens TaxID=180675 RepID=A0A8X8ZFP8_SALSN|nr:hypothetical protein SASPL_135359 [Salvia splendens]
MASQQPPRIAILGAGIFESATSAVEIAKKFFPDVECKWGDSGLDEIIQDASIIGVDMSLRLLKAGKHVTGSRIHAFDCDVATCGFTGLLQSTYSNYDLSNYCFANEAGTELERAISSYASINPAPIWAVAENYRFEPAFVEGKKLMAEIGDIINIHVIIEGSMNNSNPYYSSSWRRGFDGGFILDMGVHFISGLRMVSSVSAVTSHVDSTLPGPDHVSSTIQLENGSSGVFVMVVSSRTPKVIWRIVGLKGTLQVERGSKDGKHGYTVLLYTADEQVKSWFYPFSGVTEELKTFFSDISLANLKKDGNYQVEPRLSYLEGARDVAVLDAMLESGKKQGVPVQVNRF